MRFRKTITLIQLLLATLAHAHGQRMVSGRVVDQADGKPLTGATVVLSAPETTLRRGASTDANGMFSFTDVPQGKFSLSVHFIGYKEQERTLTMGQQDVAVGVLRLSPQDKEIGEVEVAGVLRRQEQRGDTTIFNADAFKVNPDATAEDLLKKMPGMRVTGGSVTHGGEAVQKVLVDGKEFFASDPMMALRNIDATMVDKIEVFDKKSEQSEFTGFADGNDARTINIRTKAGASRNAFGHLYGGYGSDKHYEVGCNINLLRNDHRLVLLGQANNSGLQDMPTRATTGSSRANVGSLGLNHTADGGGKVKVESSYLFNHTKNESGNSSVWEYFRVDEAAANHTYETRTENDNKSNGHNANIKVNWTADPRNSIVLSAALNWQSADAQSASNGADLFDGLASRSTCQRSDNRQDAFGLNADITIKHKFLTPRRTLSLRVRSSVNKSDNNGTNRHLRTDAGRTDTTSTGLKNDNESHSRFFMARAVVTTPLGSHFALLVDYAPRIALSSNDKRTMTDTVSNAQQPLNSTDFTFSPSLSNKKSSRYVTHRGGLSLNFSHGKNVSAQAGLDAQLSFLTGDQTYPYSFDSRRTFFDLLPTADIRLNKPRRANLRLSYRSMATAPSVSQMQNVVDMSNAHNYTCGNEKLRQSTQHTLRLTATLNNAQTSRLIFFMANLMATRHYIASATFLAQADSVITTGVLLPAGTQLTKPMNIGTLRSAALNANLSSPIKWLSCNGNMSLGASLQKRPGMYNGTTVWSKTSSLNAGLGVSSSFSETLDFNLGYDANINFVKSSATKEGNYNYYTHIARTDISCLFANRRLAANSQLRHNLTSGMGRGFDSDYLTWNASIAVKMLHKRNAELRLRVNDILDNGRNTRRSVHEAYVSTSNDDVTRRFAMLTFTYRLRPDNEAQRGGRDRQRGERPAGHRR